VKVTWDAEDFDTNNNFDLTAERFTPTVAGKYQINLTAYSQDVSSYLHVALYKNGAYYGGNVGSGNNANRGTTVGMVVDMNGSTDYLEAYAYVYGSGTVNIYGASQNWTHFSGFRIGGGGSGTDTLAGLSCAAGEVVEWDGSAWVCGTGSGSGGVNAPPVISFSGGGTTTATLASGMTLYQNNTRNAWGSYPTLPDYLVGTKGTDTVNGTPDGSAVTLSISGGSALCYMLRNSTWAAVPTTNWSLTGSSFGSYDQIYERVFPPGNYTLDSYSAMYACSTSLVGGGSGSDTAAGSVAGALQFNDGSDAFAADDLNLVWDDTNNRLGIGTAAPERSLSLTGGNIGFQESAQARSIVWGPAASSQKASIDGSEGASSYLAFATAGAERLRIDSNGGVSIGSGAGANASSLLDLTSTTKGFLPPRMTTAQRDAIATPATGLVIYNTTTNSLDFFNGTVWSSGALTSLPGSKGLSISGTVTSASATTFNVSAVTTNTLLGSNPTTSAITIPEAGNYFMTAVQNTCTGGANGYGSVIIKVNGVTRRSANSLPNSCDSATVGLYAVLAAGDTVAAECGQNNAVSTTCYFDIAKLQSDTALGGGGSSQWTTAGSDIHYGTGGVAVGQAAAPEVTAALEIESTTKGFLPPRMTTTQRDAIASPAEGLVVYNTTTKSLDLRVASSWLSFGGGMTGNTMVTGWPDAIRCDDAGTDDSTYVLGQHLYASKAYYYRVGVTNSWIAFNNPGGTWNSRAGAEATDCVGQSIAQLYTAGKAFNFVGGATASADGTSGQVQFNEGGNLKADAALYWDNTNKRLGLGTASPLRNLHINSASSEASIVLTRADGLADNKNWRIFTQNSGAGTAGMLIFDLLNDAGTAPTVQPMRILNTGSIGMGASPDASALLDVSSTTKGFLPPRMTTAQRDAIASPAEGLVVYNTTTKSLDLRVASSWLSFGGSMTGNSMVSGWPDVILCNVNTWGYSTFYPMHVPHTSGTYVYRSIWDGAGTDYSFTFTSAGAYQSTQNLPTNDCNGKSISQLYSEGKAFNFVGGVTASADGTAGQIQFNEGGNLRADAALHWDNTNKRLGIGTATPGAMLHILKTGSQANQTISSDTQAQILLSSPNNYLYLHNGTAGADQKYLRISNSGGNTAFYVMKDDLSGVQHTPLFLQHSSGNVGIGTASPGYKLHSVGGFRLAGSSGSYIWSERSDSEFDIMLPSGSTKRGLTLHASTTGSSGNLMELYGHNGTAFNIAMSVTNAGNVGIGTTTPNGKLHVVGNMIVGPANVSSYGDTTHGGVGIQGDGLNGRLFITSGSSYIQEFNWQPTGTRVGSITITGSATSYNTTSDRRLKKNIGPTAKGLDTLLRIDVKDFNFIDDAARGRVQGFIAQDLYEVYPEAVTTNGDDGAGPLENGKGWAVDYGRITPLLVKSIQELKADNDNLRAELKAANDNYMKQLNELRTRMQALERTTMEAR